MIEFLRVRSDSVAPQAQLRMEGMLRIIRREEGKVSKTAKMALVNGEMTPCNKG